jgi:hypothetical protein
MPQGPSTLHGRVAKTFANPKSLNVSNIVALKREINTCSRGQLQQANNTLPGSTAYNAPRGLPKDAIIQWIGEVIELCGLLTDHERPQEGSLADLGFPVSQTTPRGLRVTAITQKIAP